MFPASAASAEAGAAAESEPAAESEAAAEGGAAIAPRIYVYDLPARLGSWPTATSGITSDYGRSEGVAMLSAMLRSSHRTADPMQARGLCRRCEALPGVAGGVCSQSMRTGPA